MFLHVSKRLWCAPPKTSTFLTSSLIIIQGVWKGDRQTKKRRKVEWEGREEMDGEVENDLETHLIPVLPTKHNNPNHLS